MKSRFRLAADWDEKIVDRHKGEVIGKIHWNPGSGDVTIWRGFDDMDSLERCDVLHDVIGLLEREYERAKDDLSKKYDLTEKQGNQS